MFGSYQGIASAMPQSPKEQQRLQALRENGTGNAEPSALKPNPLHRPTVCPKAYPDTNRDFFSRLFIRYWSTCYYVRNILST